MRRGRFANKLLSADALPSSRSYRDTGPSSKPREASCSKRESHGMTRKSSISWRSTRSHAVHRRVSRRSRVIPARPWPGTAGLYLVEPVMRFDRRIRIWPDRDRFVLSNAMPRCCCGPSCNLTAPRQQRRVRTPGQAVVTARRHPPLPPAQQQRRRGTEYHWVSGVETTNRSAGAGGSPPASAWRSRAGGWPAATKPAPASTCSTTTSTQSAAMGCLWKHRFGGGLAGRPSPARRPVLDLR